MAVALAALLLTVLCAAAGGGRRRGLRLVPTTEGRDAANRSAPPGRTDGRDAWRDDDGAALAARFAAGDEAAIRAVHERYAGPVHTVAFATLGDRELAREAVQITFLKAWRSIDRYDPSRPLAPWLYAIARRVAIDVARAERRHTHTTELDEADVAVTPVSIERTWEVWQVRQAIETLPSDERVVVRMQHLEGHTHREIADRLDVALGTVKSRSHRAHRRLAAALVHLREEAS